MEPTLVTFEAYESSRRLGVVVYNIQHSIMDRRVTEFVRVWKYALKTYHECWARTVCP